MDGTWSTVKRAGRATRYLFVAAALTFGMYLYIAVLLITVIGTVALICAWMLPETVIQLRRVAGARRTRASLWTGRPIPESYEPISGPVRTRLRAAVRDPATSSDLRWLACNYLYGTLFLVTLVLWPLSLVVDGLRSAVLRRGPVVLPLIIGLADLDARWSTALLKPSLQARRGAHGRELATARARAIAAHDAELRRIERDLHDGTQARLVALSLRIGLAQRVCDHDPEGARRLLADAQGQAQEALTELRHVVHGIHPPVLADRGLAGAVRALAADSGLHVTVNVDGRLDAPDTRAPAATEAAVYFAVAEALTNAAKHAGSGRASVRLEHLRNGLRAVVRDEGRGGADENGGSGLRGLRRRVAALDGTVEVSSPVGGPTVIDVELPCVW
ncbi:histidine kinase [Streptomyces sp. NPDC005648]|uniref:sensor histidine kinase n=1 Tax=Streptomyces sp. NPDC005648 TaxID=3157044 RepID=UPI0033A9A79A